MTYSGTCWHSRFETVDALGGVGTGLALILTRRTKKQTPIAQARQNKKIAVSMCRPSCVSLLNRPEHEILAEHEHCQRRKAAFSVGSGEINQQRSKFRQEIEKICATEKPVGDTAPLIVASLK